MRKEDGTLDYGDHFPFTVLLKAMYRPAFTAKGFAEVAKVPPSMVEMWKRQHPEFRQALADSKKMASLTGKAASAVCEAVRLSCDLPSFRALPREEQIQLCDEMLNSFRQLILLDLEEIDRQ